MAKPPLRKVWLYEKGDLRLWADTLKELDAKVERYVQTACAAREKRVRAALKRKAGRQRADFKKALEAVQEGESGEKEG